MAIKKLKPVAWRSQRPPYRTRKAPFTQFRRDRVPRTLSVVCRSPRHLRLHYTSADLRLAGIRLANSEYVSSFGRQRFRFGFVLWEVLCVRDCFDGVVLFDEFHVHVYDVVPGALGEDRGDFLAFRVCLGSDVRILFALVRHFGLGPRVERHSRRRRRFRTQSGHRQLK